MLEMEKLMIQGGWDRNWPREKEKKSNTPVKLCNNPAAVCVSGEKARHLMFEGADAFMEETESDDASI